MALLHFLVFTTATSEFHFTCIKLLTLLKKRKTKFWCSLFFCCCFKWESQTKSCVHAEGTQPASSLLELIPLSFFWGQTTHSLTSILLTDIKSFGVHANLFVHTCCYLETIKWPADSLTFPGSLQATFAINTCLFKHKYKYIHIGCYNLIQ